MSNLPPFLPGLELCERYFFELIKPLLDEHFPSLEYVACRLGPGSDVLSFDTEQSRDHDWGPKCDLLFNDENSFENLETFFDLHLKGKTVAGYSTEFNVFNEDDGQKTLINVLPGEKGATLGLRLMTMKNFFFDYLQWSIDDENEPTIVDWLTFPSQHLVTIDRGRIFYQTERMSIEKIRKKLSFYPDDIWFYLLGSLWQRIGQEEHLMSRAGQIGDELGSTLIANRICRDVMRLIFLLERKFYPYAKWFGTAFQRWTTSGIEFQSILRQIQLAEQWQIRQNLLGEVSQRLARLFNEKFFSETSSSSSIDCQVTQFHGRPFLVINAGRIAEKIFSKIENLQIRSQSPIGSVDVFSDNTDALSIDLRFKMKKIYE